MKKMIAGLMSVLCVLCWFGFSDASARIKATGLFPYEVTQIGDLQDPLCEAEIIGESCEAGESITKTEEVPYSGEVSGAVGYSGEVGYSGTVEYSGTTPFTYTTYDISKECIEIAGRLAPECPADRWTEWEAGKCPSKSEYPSFAVRCEDKSEWVWGFFGSKVYKHRFFLENRDNCCKADGQSGNWTCFGINPTVLLDPTNFCYAVYTPSEVTVDVPYSGSVGYQGSVGYEGVTTATLPYKGTVPFTYTTAGDVVFTPGQAVTKCENVGIEQLIDKVCPGETFKVRGSGYIWREKPSDVIKSRFTVVYQEPGKAKKTTVYKEDRDLADVADGEFKEEREFTFENPGTYTIRYWVYNKGTPVSLAKERVIEVPEACEQLPE